MKPQTEIHVKEQSAATRSFEDKFREQEIYFQLFMRWFQGHYSARDLRRATREEERNCMDFHATMNGEERRIEVKTELIAHSTGEVAYEIVSQARIQGDCVLGWGLRMQQTDYLAYSIPGLRRALLFYPESIQQYVIENYGQLGNARSKNKGYWSLCVRLPVDDIARIACDDQWLPDWQELAREARRG